MQTFLHNDFLLQSDAARRLYHDHAAPMPIVDYHCHLPAEDIANDRRFTNLTRAWLEGDHYKWRAMRINGMEESYCTGNVSDREKFQAWARTVPHTLMNPLYHWTHLELRRYFGVDELLNAQSADAIYDACSTLLQTEDFSCRNLLRRMNVRLVCTTNDPAETLSAHEAIAGGPGGLIVVPGFRADRASAIQNPAVWRGYLQDLGTAADIDIRSPDTLLEALQQRHDYFAAHGCVVSDHGEETLYAQQYAASEVKAVFDRSMRGLVPTHADVALFKSWLLYELALMDHAKGWVQQFHLSALRNTNSRAPAPDSGYDSIGDFALAERVARFLDRLHSTGQLAKTILYSVNPAHNEVLASMCGNFSEHPVPGKIQFGTAWWFMDQIDGMVRQLTALANMGLISRFVGMLTDSRSFLSFPRHEYFRRILCDMIGGQMERGELPMDTDWMGKVVQDICFTNAWTYFGLDRIRQR
ncbi:MAG: glucuronate isomerase [Bacteroidota bacterium]|nr:glucuronate isomerase [Bacteroidota bacterium]